MALAMYGDSPSGTGEPSAFRNLENCTAYVPDWAPGFCVWLWSSSYLPSAPVTANDPFPVVVPFGMYNKISPATGCPPTLTVPVTGTRSSFGGGGTDSPHPGRASASTEAKRIAFDQ